MSTAFSSSLSPEMWTGLLGGAVVAVAILVLFIKSSAASGDSWLPGVPAPASHLTRNMLIGHVHHLGSAAPPRNGSPDMLGGLRELFGPRERTEKEVAQSTPPGTTDHSQQPPAAGLTAFYFGRNRALSATRGDHIRKLLGAITARRQLPLWGKHIANVLGSNSLIMADSEAPSGQWHAHRKLVTRGFYAESLSSMVPAMDATLNTLITTLRRRVTEAPEKSIDILNLSKMATLDVIGQVSFGTDFGCGKDLQFSPIGAAFNVLVSDYGYRTSGTNVLNPLLLFYSLPTKRNKANANARNTVRGVMEKLVAERRVEFSGSSSSSSSKDNNGVPFVRNDTLSLMLRARDGGGGESEKGPKSAKTVLGAQKKVAGISEEVLVDQLVTILFAGYDTTSIAVAFSLWFLWRHPEAEKRIEVEANEVLGTIDQGGQASVSDINRLTFTAAVLKEAMRLYGPVPATFRRTDRDVDLGGGLPIVPKGTTLLLPFHIAHRSPLNWTNPNAFDPDRFMVSRTAGSRTSNDSDGNNDEDADNSTGGSEDDDQRRRRELRNWFPFSFGRRDCVGRRFALQEGALLLARLVQAVTVEFPQGYDPEPMASGVLQPATPMMARVRVK